MTSPRAITRLPEIIDHYDLIICDVWGVLHNGVAAFEPAHKALSAARRAGKTVILLSNAPRPHGSVIPQLDALGVPRDAYDAIVTSGDMARSMLIERGAQPFYLLGPDRDLPLIEGLSAVRADIESAGYVLCSGLFDDETETPDDYDPILRSMKERGLTMLCANPDLVVEKGHRLLYCAGALAERYMSLGGEAVMIGKPFAIAYRAACAKAEAIRGGLPAKDRILAIGDAIRTDVRGARDFGIASLFLANGIHADELMDEARTVDPAKMSAFLARQSWQPDFFSRHLEG
ncbi:MAG: TIGR01459 family HAD-type hydrolase [Beijerinckiaceae bacterium]|nr:TIGR01459 family HAD-type hydrolase [Beijerinckiaceae bacterium]